MGDSRTKNVSRNITMGFIYKIVSLLLPFVTRTLLLYYLGTKSVGANTLFSSILSFLSLAELGFGSSVVFAMYKPIAENNIEAINALLKYYKQIYRLIGTIILLVGVIIAPFLNYLIKGDPPEGINITILYFLYLFNTVISYFIAGYRQSLLIAYQRADIRDKIALFITICVRVLEIIVIICSRNIYAYVCIAIFGTICTNIITAYVTKRIFPDIECKGEISVEQKKEITKKISGLFGTKLNSIVVNQADTIVISAFLGLTLLAQYGNYYYILNAVSGFVMVIFSSMTASIGNKIASDTTEDVYRLFQVIDFINNWIVGWCSICMLCLYRPFMILWVKESLTLPFLMSLLMSVYFYIYQIQRTLLTFKDAGGIWYEDRYRPYISMIINVITNIILVQFIGIYGVVVSTIIAFSISVPWCNYVVFKYLFFKSPIKNLLKMVRNVILTSVVCIITVWICSFLQYGFGGIIERMVVCLIIPNVLFFFIFRKKKEFSVMINYVSNVINRGKKR